jgi:hypothetical protein
MSIAKAALAVAAAIVGVAAAAGELSGRQSGEPAAFLQRLAGEWSVVSEAVLGPGQEPIRTESHEVARLLGGRWLVAESTRMVGDRPVTSILTVGQGPAREGFVATFIDEMQAHLWSYTGTLDDAGTSLTLDTEGPILGDPTRTARFRVVIESRGVDHKAMRSMILGPDGEWFEFSNTDYRPSRP